MLGMKADGPDLPSGESLSIPFYDWEGNLLPFFQVKFAIPRIRLKDDGTEQTVKYENPRGVQAVPYIPRETVSRIKDVVIPIYFVEGAKKALKMTQEGFSAIGLTGISMWSAPRKKSKKGHSIGQRSLHRMLASLPLNGRTVYICFDQDKKRNPDVHREAAEFARVLEDHGAIVHIIALPIAWNEKLKRHDKQGPDDYLLRHSPEELRRFIDEQIRPREELPLKEYRRRLQEAQLRDLSPGLKANTAPPGSGKSYNEITRALRGEHTLFLVPTHSQEEDLIKSAGERGLRIVPFPKRSANNCDRYSEIKDVEELSLNSTDIVCSGCPTWNSCRYREELEDAKRARVACATHERFRRVGKSLTRGRDSIAVQEDALNVLAATIPAFRDGIRQLESLLYWGRFNGFNTPFYRNAVFWCRWLLHVLENAAETEKFPCPRKNLGTQDRDRRTKHIDRKLHDLIKSCRDRQTQRHSPSEKVPEEPLESNWVPREREAPVKEGRLPLGTLTDDLREKFSPEAIRFLVLLLSGRFARVYVKVLRSPDEPPVTSLVGVQDARFYKNAIVTFADSTLSIELLPVEFQGKVGDLAPQAGIKRHQDVVQYPDDVTKKTSPQRFVRIVRAIFRQYPNAAKVGLITQKCLKGALDLLTPSERERIVKLDHFRGTESRGSNIWKDACDLLLVIGTPRVHQSAIEDFLLQTGLHLALRRGSEWAKTDYWSGRSPDGKRITKGFRDHDWNRVYRYLVHSELIQSIERSRSICKDGISDTVVVTTEELGYPIIDAPLPTLNDRIMEVAIRVYAAFGGIALKNIPKEDRRGGYVAWFRESYQRLIPAFAYRDPIIQKRELAAESCLVGQAIAKMTGLSKTSIYRDLEKMRNLGLIARKGKHGGFYLTEENWTYFREVTKQRLKSAGTEGERFRRRRSRSVPECPISPEELEAVKELPDLF